MHVFQPGVSRDVKTNESYLTGAAGDADVERLFRALFKEVSTAEESTLPISTPARMFVVLFWRCIFGFDYLCFPSSWWVTQERQRIGSVESGSGDQLVPGGIRGASASVSTPQAAAASAASSERFYSADGAGIDAAAVAAASSSRATVAGTAAPILRARSAQGLGAASAGRRDEDDAVMRSFSYQAGADGAPQDGGADSPEGCRLA